MLTVIPGAFHALMGLLMFKYKISDRVYEDIKQALPDMEILNEEATPKPKHTTQGGNGDPQVSV